MQRPATVDVCELLTTVKGRAQTRLVARGAHSCFVNVALIKARSLQVSEATQPYSQLAERVLVVSNYKLPVKNALIPFLPRRRALPHQYTE